jgi:hypothetical protein
VFLTENIHSTLYEDMGYSKVLQHGLLKCLLEGQNNQSLEVTFSCFRGLKIIIITQFPDIYNKKNLKCLCSIALFTVN